MSKTTKGKKRLKESGDLEKNLHFFLFLRDAFILWPHLSDGGQDQLE